MIVQALANANLNKQQKETALTSIQIAIEILNFDSPNFSKLNTLCYLDDS